MFKKVIFWMVIVMSFSLTCCAENNGILLNKFIGETVFSYSTNNTEAYVNELVVVEDFSPGCTKIGNRAVGGLCQLGKNTYFHGIGVNAPSKIRIKLANPAVRFTCNYGLDRNVDKTEALVEFKIESHGKTLFESGLIYPDGKEFSLDLTLDNLKEFDLIVTDGGNGPGFDQGDWCNGKIYFSDGSSVFIDGIGAKIVFPDLFPFSFEYGNEKSEDFLKNWDISINTEESDSKTIRTIIATDPKTKLEVKAVAQIYKKTAGIDWTVYLTNKSTENTPIIKNFKALDITLNIENGTRTDTKYANPTYIEPSSASQQQDPVLHRLKGTEGFIYFTQDDFMPITDKLPKEKEVIFGVPGSYSSHEMFPFFNTTFRGGGVITAIGWTGKWEAGVKHDKDGKLNTYAKMKDLNLTLYPNESIRSPRILQMYWQGSDIDESYNLFRKTMIEYIVPRFDGEILEAPISHMTSSFYEVNSTTYEIEKSYIDAIEKNHLGFEVYWLDAWWHNGGFPNGLGNYVYPLETPIDMERFPSGIKGISDYAKSKNLDFLCWFAPETLSDGSLLAKEHPEWMLPKGAKSGNFNLGIDAAREYITDYMDACIKNWGINIWRTDIGWTLDGIKEMEKETPDRIGILEIRQVEGFYRLWDDLIDRNPGLLIDNCCGGGSRIDIETSSRSIPLWRTDGSVHTGFSRNLKDMAIQNQDNTLTLNRYIPQSTGGTMGATPYYVRSGFNYGFTFDEDNREDDYRNDLLKQGIEEVKRLRKYVFGDFYPLIFKNAEYDEWCAYQYHLKEEDAGMALVFRRDDSPFTAIDLFLKEGTIDIDASYEVTEYGESYKSLKTSVIKGSELLSYPVTIKEKPASALIEYKLISL